MTQQTPEEKAQAKLARMKRAEERKQRSIARRQRSEEAMAQGPHVYASSIIASWLQIPIIHFWYSLFSLICDYIFGGHIIVKNWQKLLVRTGYISEGALGVAGVWALVNHVAIIHNMLAGNSLTKQIIDPMNGFMMGSFTLIPDLILASAILMTFSRWGACRQKEGRTISILWATLYSACTVTFFGLTLYTLSTVGSVAGSGDITKVIYASGTELQIRVISSFIYGLSEVIYAYTHKGQNSATLFQPATPAPDVAAIVNKAITEQAAKHEQAMHDLHQELATLTQQLETPQSVVPAVSEESIVEAVMKQLDTRIETFLTQQQARVSITETPQSAAPTVSEEAIVSSIMKQLEARLETSPKRQIPQETSTTRTRKQSTPSTPEQENGASNEAVIHKHLEEDRSINHRKLAALTGISESTCYRIRKAWIQAHPVVSSDPNETVEEEEDETAM